MAWRWLEAMIAAFSGPFRRPGGSLGQRGEALAARFLRQSGLTIVARGVASPAGELDLVARDGETLVFVEVKTRSAAERGQPWEAVNATKRRRVTRAAVAYLQRHRLTGFPVRFDVVAITWPVEGQGSPSIEHFPDAFNAQGPWSV